MTFVVPFDGASRTKAALQRGATIGSALGESVVAVAVIPMNDTAYARQQGWLGSDEPFDLERVVTTLRERVHDIAPDATFEYERARRGASGNQIAKPIRKFAKGRDASMVFIGSENAGRLVTSQSSIGGRICTDGDYDVVLVRDQYQG
jgi:nucleotide-binding universal stress UspA family protein